MRESKNVLKIISSIVVGLICAAIIFFVLISGFFALGLFGWSDGGDRAYLHKLEITTQITLIFSITAALCTGFYIIIKMSRTKPNTKTSDSDIILP